MNTEQVTNYTTAVLAARDMLRASTDIETDATDLMVTIADLREERDAAIELKEVAEAKETYASDTLDSIRDENVKLLRQNEALASRTDETLRAENAVLARRLAKCEAERDAFAAGSRRWQTRALEDSRTMIPRDYHDQTVGELRARLADLETPKRKKAKR